jgi:hypothetical protein
VHLLVHRELDRIALRRQRGNNGVR